MPLNHRHISKTSFWLVMTSMLIAGCYVPQTGALSPETQGELEWLALGTYDTETKYHNLGTKLSEMLNEALKKNGEAAQMSFMDAYYQDNKASLEKLGDEFFDWQRAISLEDKTAFLFRVHAYPYSANLKKKLPSLRKQVAYNKNYLDLLDQLFEPMQFEN